MLASFQGKSLDSSLIELCDNQLVALEGGSFFEDTAFVVGYAAHALWVFAHDAGAYQSSLPPSLKK